MNIQETKWAWRAANRALAIVGRNGGVPLSVKKAAIIGTAGRRVIEMTMSDGHWDQTLYAPWHGRVFMDTAVSVLVKRINDAVYDWRPHAEGERAAKNNRVMRQAFLAGLAVAERRLGLDGCDMTLVPGKFWCIDHEGDCVGMASAHVEIWGEDMGYVGASGNWSVEQNIHGGWRWIVDQTAESAEEAFLKYLDQCEADDEAEWLVAAEGGYRRPALALAA